MDLNEVNQWPFRWRRIVERKEADPDPSVRTSIFAGIDRDARAPVFIPRSVFSQGHYHISGRIGSGKTASALASIALQILRQDSVAGGANERSPLVVIDLKGDLAFFNTVREAAERAGRSFRYLSTRPGDDYHFFDPFQMFRLASMQPLTLASEFVRAFSLDYGLIYGGLYFTQVNVAILLDAIKEMIARNKEPTIGTLSDILTTMARKASNKDAKHIDTCLKFLAELPQMNIRKHKCAPDQQIDMLRVLEDCEVVYVALPLETEAPTLRQVASLILYTLVHAAAERNWLGKPHRETFVIIDEFYHIAGKSFGELLSTVRDRNIRVVLANQTRSQLKAHDDDLPDVVQAITSVKQAFTLMPEEVEYFAAESGQKIAYRRNYSLNPKGEMSQSASEYLTTKLDEPAMQEINDTHLACVLQVHDGVYYRERRVRRVQTLFPQTLAEYEQHRRTPFPRRRIDPEEHPESQMNFNDAPTGEEKSRASVEADRSPPEPAVSPDIGTSLATRMQKVWEQLQAEELS